MSSVSSVDRGLVRPANRQNCAITGDCSTTKTIFDLFCGRCWGVCRGEKR